MTPAAKRDRAADGQPSAAVLALRSVTKAFATPAGTVPVLNDVDLQVASGEIVVITGRSGAGKTTLLTIASGWDHPDRGTADLPGGQSGAARWSDIAVVPQGLALLEELTILENITLPHRLAGGAGRGRAAQPDRPATDLMRQLGIDHLAARYPDEVSLGEQQRAAIARAMVAAPRLLVADEPIAHQNEELARTVMSALRDLADHFDHRTACLVATHNDQAFAVADRVMDLGDRLQPAAAQ